MNKTLMTWITPILAVAMVGILRTDVDAASLVLRLAMTALLIHFFLIPFITKKTMRLPSYSYKYEEGKDVLTRIYLFTLACVLIGVMLVF
jgi:hypothetical protein